MINSSFGLSLYVHSGVSVFLRAIDFIGEIKLWYIARNTNGYDFLCVHLFICEALLFKIVSIQMTWSVHMYFFMFFF